MTYIGIRIENGDDFASWFLSFGEEAIASGTADGEDDAFEAALVAAGEAFGLRKYPALARFAA